MDDHTAASTDLGRPANGHQRLVALVCVAGLLLTVFTVEIGVLPWWTLLGFPIGLSVWLRVGSGPRPVGVTPFEGTALGVIAAGLLTALAHVTVFRHGYQEDDLTKAIDDLFAFFLFVVSAPVFAVVGYRCGRSLNPAQCQSRGSSSLIVDTWAARALLGISVGIFALVAATVLSA